MGWDKIPDWAQTVAFTLLQALKERDPYTYGHSIRVARNARLLAHAAGLNEFEQKAVEYASLFHDLGKIGVPDSVLLKPGPLTDEEEALMRAHPVKSADIISPLKQIPFFRATIPGILHHHERIDGAGYPDGITGDHIPLLARLILIVDTFDAMTTSRPYRRGLTPEIAYKELQIFSGRQFDEQIVRIFVKAHPQWPAIEDDLSTLIFADQLRKAA